MTDESVWNINNTGNSFETEQATDPVLKIESWMLDEKLFNSESFEIQPVEIEAPVKMESWMVNEKYWNIK